MYGPGLAPPQPQRPSTAMLVVLRVIFVLLSLLSIGFLSWGSLLRVAMVTRKRSDWVLFWISVAAVVAGTVFLISDPTTELSTWRGDVGMALLLLSAVATAAYFLYADVRHHQDQRWPGGPGTVGYGAQHPHPQSHPASGYGYPAPAPGQGQTPSGPLPHTVPQHHALPHTPHAPHTPSGPHPAGPAPYGATSPMADIPGPARTPVPPAAAGPAAPYQAPVPIPPAGPAPATGARIDQVRAELDELSDYLRRQNDESEHGGATGAPGAPGQRGGAPGAPGQGSGVSGTPGYGPQGGGR